MVTHVTSMSSPGEFFQQEGSRFISSMPLQELVPCFDLPLTKEVQQAALSLRYRDFITVCLIVNRAKVFPDTWIYIHDPSVRIARVRIAKTGVRRWFRTPN